MLTDYQPAVLEQLEANAALNGTACHRQQCHYHAPPLFMARSNRQCGEAGSPVVNAERVLRRMRTLLLTARRGGRQSDHHRPAGLVRRCLCRVLPLPLWPRHRLSWRSSRRFAMKPRDSALSWHRRGQATARRRPIAAAARWQCGVGGGVMRCPSWPGRIRLTLQRCWRW